MQDRVDDMASTRSQTHRPAITSIVDVADGAPGIVNGGRSLYTSGPLNAVELILILLATSVALAICADRLRLPYPIVLVIGGIALAFGSGLPRVEIRPELVLVIFLPPLLFAAAWFTSWRDFAANLRSISLLAIGLVIATTAGVAAVAHAVIPGMPWAVAFVLGAIVSPPDAVAATAIMQRLRVPSRLVTILEGESLVNDATGLVAFQVALAAVGSGGFSAPHALGQFALVALGGISVGLVVGWVVAQVHRRLDDFLLETVISVITAYVAYIAAEHLGVSGVLATVAAGGFLGWRNPQLFSPLTRLRSRSVWSVLLFLFNSLVFILIGLELAATPTLASGGSSAGVLGWGAAIAGATIGIRLAWVPIVMFLPYRIRCAIRGEAPAPVWKGTVVVAWTAMRGIVSLALALALPRTLPGGAPFPFRDLLVLLVFAVIVVTLLGQGLTLPLVIKALRFADEGAALRQEREGLLRGTERALARLNELDQTSIIMPWLVERLRATYEERLGRLKASVRDDPECRLMDGDSLAFQRLRGQLIDAERGAVVAMRNGGEISEEVLHKLQQDLDLEALQPLR
jgi:Na+/H+ antiporter